MDSSVFLSEVLLFELILVRFHGNYWFFEWVLVCAPSELSILLKGLWYVSVGVIVFLNEFWCVSVGVVVLEGFPMCVSVGIIVF